MRHELAQAASMTWEFALPLIGTLVVWTGSLVWFVAAQFSANRTLMWKAITQASDKIIAKLEYHERHDDERFEQMSKDIASRYHTVNNRIWNIELRNAAKDGVLPTEYKRND